MSLGKNVRKLREARGWEQKDLAHASGVPNGTISAIEVRDSKRSAVAPALAKALGVTVEQLMSDDIGHALAAPEHQSRNTPTEPGVQSAEPTTEKALEVVASRLNELPDAQRELAAQQLQTLARAPDSAKAMQALLTTLQSVDAPAIPPKESSDACTLPRIVQKALTPSLNIESAEVFNPLRQHP